MLQEVVEAFIRMVKAEIDDGAICIAADDVFEVPKGLPSVILQGPSLTEDSQRRAVGVDVFNKDIEAGTYQSTPYPRYYHLDFDIIVTASKATDLLQYLESITRLFQVFPSLHVPDIGDFGLTELIPVGGLKRVNLSNLRQSSGRCRIEDVPIPTNLITDGKLILTTIVEYSMSGEGEES